MKKRHTLYELGTTLDLCNEAPHGYFVGRIEPILVTTAWKDYRSKADLKVAFEDCCEAHPEDPIVKIDKISLTPDFSNIVITATASHACGISKVTAYIAKVRYETTPLGTPVRVISPILFGEDFLEDSKDFPEGVKPVNATLRIPTKKLIGTSFYIAVTAIDRCGHTGGDVSTRRLIT